MLSNVSIERIGRVFQWLYFIGVSPLKWNRKIQRFYPEGSSGNLVCVWASSILYFLYCINMTYSMIARLIQSSFTSEADLALNFSWCCCFDPILLCVWTTLWRRRDIAGYLNQLLSLDAYLATIYTRKQTQGRNLLDQLTRLIFPWISFNTTAIFVIYLLDQENPRYLYYHTGKLPVLFAAAELLMNWQMYSAIAMYWVLSFTLFTFITTCWLKEMVHAMEYNKAGRVLRIVRSYQQLQMINNRHKDCFSSLAWPSFILCAMSCHAFCIYMITMVHNQLNPLEMLFIGSWVIVWLFIQVVVYTVVGEYERLSLELRRSCLLHCGGKLDRRREWSLRPMKVKVGEYGTIDRSTALVAILGVSNVTVNAILIL